MKNISEMKGEELYDYYTSVDCPDRNLSDMVSLLSYAIGKDRSIEILESIIKSGKTLVAIYPGLGEHPEKDMQYVGSIPDGELYIE